MQRMQRKFGRFLPRTPNEADIASMLRDFEDSAEMLEKIEAAAKQWRDAWTNILAHQLSAIEHYHTLYKPLGAKGGDYGSHVYVDTPEATLERCVQLEQAFNELKIDMMEEVKDIDKKLIIPAQLARDALKPMQKAIKKREDKKVDYERYKSRTETLESKKTRSDRDNTALTKHTGDLQRATQEYEHADEALRVQLPRLNAATFSILPHLLANQIILQNNLIGNLYTVLHQYSREQGYPDPPPELEEVIPVFEGAFTSLRNEVETGFDVLKGGKAIHQPMRLPDKGDTISGLGIRNKVMPSRRTSSNTSVPTVRTTSPRPGYGLPPAYEDHNNGPPVNLSSKPSISSLNASKPKIGAHSPGLSPSPSHDPWNRRPSTASYASSNGTNTTGGAHDDYFGRPRIPSAASSSISPNPAAGKKKPPPPPPKKIGSFHGEYVTAMYDFMAEGTGDLSFQEGDRIRVVKKTNSSQDWWEGELRGVKGSFPANYCK
ncbi:hypothetical protein BU24DRAFT_441145 [Aaosphaeria arxii CBS 175.79]|uniref:SH3 domain signaling protein n=1 Tax=Aaosphaeria arxii CBS 175.79 TaxID=1450172 RepID=A0A6A5XR40_9PLEO|nr:uncharacterized protein BU24DRAFT_441145 [Aaosphaeria arxii CBS 175.79]KAF2015403.1 hypothetical protein BU24DRAFT_441145 [Aaosphaeria arxii CBS 175.79]